MTNPLDESLDRIEELRKLVLGAIVQGRPSSEIEHELASRGLSLERARRLIDEVGIERRAATELPRYWRGRMLLAGWLALLMGLVLPLAPQMYPGASNSVVAVFLILAATAVLWVNRRPIR